MNRLLPFNLVLLICFGNIQWIKAKPKMDILDGDDLTKKIYESTKEAPFDKVDLEFHNFIINSISKKAFGNVTNFKNINLQKNSIKQIDSEIFSNFVHLEYVDLSRNDIKIIQKELFKYNVRIHTLVLSYNRIAEFEEEAFVNLIDLKRLFLNDNPLKQLGCETFSGNRELTVLQLSNTHLKYENECLFQNLPVLRYLNLSVNLIVKISENLFKNNNKLQGLYLNDNRIVDVHKNAFQNLSAVSNLYLASNNIIELDENCFSNMKSLYYLKLNNNRITKLPPGLFNKNRRLQRLSLEQNQLTTITNENFRMNEVLSYLNLARNKISHLDVSAFDGLHILEHLDLQFNEIEDLPNKIFHQVNKTLEVLLLNNNKLKKIHEDVFSVVLRFLHILNLSHNNLSNCDFYNYHNFPKLRDLHLNNNKLQQAYNIFPMTRPQGYKFSLQYVYLEFNGIGFDRKYRSNYNIGINDNYKFLNMSNNNITSLIFTEFGSKYIDTIFDLRNNRILYLEFYLGNVDIFLRGYLYIWESIVPLNKKRDLRLVDYYGHEKVLKIKKYDLTVNSVKKTLEAIECEDDLITVSLVIRWNHLRQIDCLSKVWTLHFIDFSYNNLTNLTKSHFAKMIYLETLDVSHNPLTSLDLNIFAASVKLTEFYFDECEVVNSWQYYRITEMFRNLTHISMQNNSIYCPLLSTIIQKYQNSNITIKGYKKDDKIVFDSVDGITCEAYKSIKDVLILVVCSSNFIIFEIIIILLAIVNYYNNKHI